MAVPLYASRCAEPEALDMAWDLQRHGTASPSAWEA